MKKETREIVSILELAGFNQPTNKYLIYNEGCSDECVMYDSSLPKDIIDKIELVSGSETELPNNLTEEDSLFGKKIIDEIVVKFAVIEGESKTSMMNKLMTKEFNWKKFLLSFD